MDLQVPMGSAAGALPRAASASTEQQRIRAHLHRADALLEAGNGSVRHPLRRLVRALLRGELARYRERGRFPRNHDFAAPTPYFVDALGTRCAVAHLLAVSGEGALVRRIAREGNNLRVPQLAAEPRLVAWLAAAGLTLEEAAAIQPTYCFSDPAECVCQVPPGEAFLEGPLVEVGDFDTTRMRIDKIDGMGGFFLEGQEIGVDLINLAQARVGDTVLVSVSPSQYSNPYDAAPPRPAWGAVFADDGTYACSTGSARLTIDQYKAALRAPGCREYLTALSPAWKRRKIPNCKDGMSCSSLPDPRDTAPTTVGILLALLSVLVLRRRTRRERLVVSAAK